MDGAHTHGPSGDGSAFVVIAGIIAIVAVIMLPVILAILQTIFYILLIVCGIAVTGGVAMLTYKVKHRHDVPAIRQRPAWQELPRYAPPKALPEAKTQGYIILTPYEYEQLRDNRDAH